MSADSIDKRGWALPEHPKEPLYFLSGTCPLFGWLHRPAGEPSASLGLVICKPFGYEAICSDRAVRCFAEAAAAIGIPSLRFDYSGTGDSGDIDVATDQLELWSRDITEAVAELRRRTGVERVCLLGFRLGALLATLAARHCQSVSALIVVAPVISGRRYLRELRTVRLAGSMGSDPPDTSSSQFELQGGDPGSMEVSGFTLSAATLATLAQLDLTKLTSVPAPEILVIDRIDLPSARLWMEYVSTIGARTHYKAEAGFVEMIMTAPQVAAVPTTMIAVMCEWLRQFKCEPTAPKDIGGRESCSRISLPAIAVASVTNDTSGSLPGVSELPVFIPSDTTIFGIVTEPRRGELRRRAVILLNAGADHHIGANRMHVSLARRWASNGYFVLRMDLAGLGESRARAGRAENEVFPPEAIEDIVAAISFMRRNYSVDDITLAGLCSGAYHALRAAVAGVALNSILMVNPQNFFWKEGMSLSALQLAEVVRNPGVYRERVLSAAAWKRLLSGRVNILRVVSVYIHRARIALESTLRDAARKAHIRLPRDLGSELEEVAARGTKVVFIFARGDPGIELLRIQGGSSVKRLGDRCRVHIIDSADHTFSRRVPRMLLENVLCDELFSRHASVDVARGAGSGN